MNTEETLAKYKRLFLQIQTQAQHLRSIADENGYDEFEKQISPQLYVDDCPTNIVVVTQMMLERFDSGLISKSDIFNTLIIATRIPQLDFAFGIGASIYHWEFNEMPRPMDAIRELVAAGVS